MPDLLGTLVLQMYRGGILYFEGIREFKKTFITRVLREHQGNQVKAARQLQMHRNTLRRLIADFEIGVKDLRQPLRRPPKAESQIPARKERAQGAGR